MSKRQVAAKWRRKHNSEAALHAILDGLKGGEMVKARWAGADQWVEITAPVGVVGSVRSLDTRLVRLSRRRIPSALVSLTVYAPEPEPEPVALVDASGMTYWRCGEDAYRRYDAGWAYARSRLTEHNPTIPLLDADLRLTPEAIERLRAAGVQGLPDGGGSDG